MNYKISEHCQSKTAFDLWKFLQNGLSKGVLIKSIKGNLYTVNYINEEEINFSANSRNKGQPEIIRYGDFSKVINSLQKCPLFNTSSSRDFFKETRIYKKRSPFFALLLTSGIIDKVD